MTKQLLIKFALIISIFTQSTVFAKITILDKTNEPLSNPYKGFYTQVDTKISNTAIPQSLAYSSFTWKDLEPKKRNKFNWEGIEKDWKWHTDRDRKIVIRFKIADPWSSDDKDYPDWLDSKQISERRYFIDGGTGIVPDWNSKEFLKEHERVILALGRRYDRNHKIAWVEVGSYGIWGEWHMFQNESLAAKISSKYHMMNAYIKAFPSQRLVMSFDDVESLDYMMLHGIGIRNDCLGTPESNNWFNDSICKLTSSNIEEIFKTELIVGEFCGGEDGAKNALSLYKDENFSFIRQNHWSNIGPAGGSYLYSDLNIGKELHKILGYRFVLDQSDIKESILSTENLKIKLTIINEGVAPFYYDWKSKLFIKNSKGKIVFDYYVSDNSWSCTNWNPGKIQVESKLPLASLNLPVGRYEVFIGIENPLSLKPGINFANTNYDNEKRFLIGEFNIREINQRLD